MPPPTVVTYPNTVTSVRLPALTSADNRSRRLVFFILREHNKKLYRLKMLRPIDDEFMRCIFKENIPLTQHVLQILTNKPDLIINFCCNAS